MRNWKVLSLATFILFLCTSLEAQKNYRFPKKDKIEFGLFFGASNYEGDLEQDPVNINHTLIGYGGFARYNFTNHFSLRFGMDYGTITDADAYATEEWRIKRNLSFTTTIFDGYLAAEWYLVQWPIGGKRYVSPYLLAGVGAFHFNPTADYKGVTYDLRPLGTEGQGTLAYPDRQPYDPNQLYIPFGGGFLFSLSSTWFVSIECRINKTFTDYLDDVSTTYASPDVLIAQNGQNGAIAAALANRTNEIYPNATDPTGQPRGNPKTTDWFFFTGITLSHTFKPKTHCYTF